MAPRPERRSPAGTRGVCDRLSLNSPAEHPLETVRCDPGGPAGTDGSCAGAAARAAEAAPIVSKERVQPRTVPGAVHPARRSARVGCVDRTVSQVRWAAILTASQLRASCKETVDLEHADSVDS